MKSCRPSSGGTDGGGAIYSNQAHGRDCTAASF